MSWTPMTPKHQEEKDEKTLSICPSRAGNQLCFANPCPRSSAQDLQTTRHAAFRSLYLWRHPRSQRTPPVPHMSKNWGVYSHRKPLFNNVLHWPPPTSPKFDPPTDNAACFSVLFRNLLLTL